MTTGPDPSGSAPLASPQWRARWREKTKTALDTHHPPAPGRARLLRLIDRYLRANPVDPARIHAFRTRAFVHDHGHEALTALLFFYRSVVPSAKHLLLLERLQTTRDPVMHPHEDADDEESGNDQAGGQTSPPESATLSQINDLLHRLHRELRAHNFSVHSEKTYLCAARGFLRRNGCRFDHHTPARFKQHLNWLHDHRGLAPTTVNLYATAIAFFLHTVCGVADSDAFNTRMKVDRPLPRLHSTQDVIRILNAPQSPKHQLMLMLAYGCGLRLNEIRLLRPSDIDLERGVVRVRGGTGRKDRLVMLDKTLVPLAADFLAEGAGVIYVFEGYASGKPISRRSIQKVYEKACSTAGIDAPRGGIHSLRHSFATHLLEQGVDIRFVQELMGHASPLTTELYTQVATHHLSRIRSPIRTLLENGDDPAGEARANC